MNEQPRKILESIPGLCLTEMERNGRWSYCCGSGAKIALNCYPDYAAETGRVRAEEAAKAAAEVVTACPVCYNQLRFTAKAEGMDLRVNDISLLLAESLGISQEMYAQREDES